MRTRKSRRGEIRIWVKEDKTEEDERKAWDKKRERKKQRD